MTAVDEDEDQLVDEPTLLKALLKVRHWQKRETFSRQWDKVAKTLDSSLAGTCPAHAQFYRWLSGNIHSIPHPDACRILEAMFPGVTVQQLFHPVRARRSELLEPLRVQPSTASNGLATPISPLAFPIASVPPSFSANALGGFWVTCYQFNSDRGMRCHADITQLTPESGRRVTAINYPPDPRTHGRVSPFRNEIEAELANRHLIGHWKNVSDTRYFGSIHLTVLSGETVMEGYYIGLTSDIRVDASRWKWVRLDPVSLSGLELSQVALKDPDVIYALAEEHSEYDAPLALAAVVEGN